MNLYDEIKRAAARLSPYILETSLEESAPLSSKIGVNVFLKNEHHQITGSFKLRGALNKMLLLSDTEKVKGIIAASSGNHGLGVAKAAKMLGVKATIFAPKNIAEPKAKAIALLGANIKLIDGDCLDAEVAAREFAKQQQQQTFISPYNDEEVIAGQGTIGLELIQQHAALDAVFISVGGGGLIAGIATVLKQHNPAIKIIGCWPQNAPALYECLQAGKIISVPEQPTLSDGTAGGVEVDAVTFPMCQALIDECVLVSEDEIKFAVKQLAESEKTVVEGAAGVALAGLFAKADDYQNKNCAVVLCGKNIALETFMEAIK